MTIDSLFHLVRHTASLFKSRFNIAVFSIALLFFIGLLSFFYGLFTIPMPTGVIGFYRMEPPTSFEIFYLFFSAIVSALIITITIYSSRMKIAASTTGRSTSALGLATGIFGAVCPACLGINFLAFGNVFTAQLAFLIPYIFWIQVGGIILLSLGLYFVAQSAYRKSCLSCSSDSPTKQPLESTPKSKSNFNNDPALKKFTAVALGAIIIFAYQITTVLGENPPPDPTSSGPNLVTTSGQTVNIDAVIESVTPKDGFTTNVKWNDIVDKMVKAGVLDPDKLASILTKRYQQPMQPEWSAVLAGEDANLTINNDNAVFMMYVLWTLAKHNQNEILTNSPFAKSFVKYDIGVGRPGYGDTPLLALTPDQQAIAQKVAANAYRPCCGNSTAAPDCSHGYSALGLIELMASQGFSESEIFAAFIQFNSFWFPETYIKNALYFKITQDQDWDNVSKELVAGPEYSTLKGSFTAKNYLKNNFGI